MRKHTAEADEACGSMNGTALKMRVETSNLYDAEGQWMAGFNRACDKFLISRGIDPSTGQRAPYVSRDFLHPKKDFAKKD